MPQYKFLCSNKKCKNTFESIEKMGKELTKCPECSKISNRIHGQDRTSPPKLIAGCGGFAKPSFGERKHE